MTHITLHVVKLLKSNFNMFWSIRKEKVASAAFPAMFINEETYLVRWKEVVCHTVTHDTHNTHGKLSACMPKCMSSAALLPHYHVMY